MFPYSMKPKSHGRDIVKMYDSTYHHQAVYWMLHILAGTEFMNASIASSVPIVKGDGAMKNFSESASAVACIDSC